MYAMIRVLTNKMASAWANTTSTSGRIYGIQLVAGGSIPSDDRVNYYIAGNVVTLKTAMSRAVSPCECTILGLVPDIKSRR